MPGWVFSALKGTGIAAVQPSSAISSTCRGSTMVDTTPPCPAANRSKNPASRSGSTSTARPPAASSLV